MPVKIRRIEKEFTFKTLISGSTKVNIHCHKKELACTVRKYTEEFLEIEASEADLSYLKKGDEVRAYFMFQNNRHTFQTVIKKVDGYIIYLQQPDGLYKDLQREFERVKLDEEVNINFKLKERRIELNFPKTFNYYPLNDLDIPENLDISNFLNLINEFRDKMRFEASENHIIMLRNKVPTTYEEKIMAKSGKILWFPTVERGLVEKSPLPEDILFSKEELYQYEEENGLTREQIEEKLERIKKNKLEKGFYSQLYCPVLYNEYFIGYIYLLNNINRPLEIDLDILKYTYEFTRILCYSLKVNNYFKAKEIGEYNYQIPIIDISASGLLFAHSEKKLPQELLLHTPIDLLIMINGRKLNISARVMRKFSDTRFCYFGVKFTSIKPEDFRFLFEYIYGKEYIQSADILWKEMENPGQ